MAEAIFRKLVADEGLADQIETASAGTGNWHEGENADGRTLRVLRDKNTPLQHSARAMRPRDLDEYDLIVCMDQQNLAFAERMRNTRQVRAQLILMRQHDPEAHGQLNVPDPYSMDSQAFDQVYDMLLRSCTVLLADLKAKHLLPQ